MHRPGKIRRPWKMHRRKRGLRKLFEGRRTPPGKALGGNQADIVSNRKGRPGRSKKALILDYREMHRLERAAMADIQTIQTELRGRLGEAGRTSVSYIANVLREAGTSIDIPPGPRNPYLEPSIEEPYATRLKGLLQFSDLNSAEKSLRNLDAAYREYSAAADGVGVEIVRTLALRGKVRAQNLSANPRVRPEKRQEKQEIAAWFRVWLQSPDLFADWLELRKNSEEFQRAFLKQNQERRPE